MNGKGKVENHADASKKKKKNPQKTKHQTALSAQKKEVWTVFRR